MTIHRVLVQGNQEIDPIAHVSDLIWTCSDGQERMSATNDGLISVVGVQVETATTEDFREDVAGCRHTLTGSASDSDGEGLGLCAYPVFGGPSIHPNDS